MRVESQLCRKMLLRFRFSLVVIARFSDLVQQYSSGLEVKNWVTFKIPASTTV